MSKIFDIFGGRKHKTGQGGRLADDFAATKLICGLESVYWVDK